MVGYSPSILAMVHSSVSAAKCNKLVLEDCSDGECCGGETGRLWSIVCAPSALIHGQSFLSKISYLLDQ